MSITDNRLFKLISNRTFQSVVGLLLTLIAVISLSYSWQVSVEEQRSNDRLRTYVKCQGEWTNFFYQATTANRNASQEATAALDELITTISTATSREQSALALENYKAARAKQIQSQRENPLPEAPKSVCQLED